mgnify:CR=1 FL=1
MALIYSSKHIENLYSRVLKNTEKKVGLSIEKIREYSPSELRQYLEEKNKKELLFLSEFPNVGRGNILRDQPASRKLINEEIDRILGL